MQSSQRVLAGVAGDHRGHFHHQFESDASRVKDESLLESLNELRARGHVFCIADFRKVDDEIAGERTRGLLIQSREEYLQRPTGPFLARVRKWFDANAEVFREQSFRHCLNGLISRGRGVLILFFIAPYSVAILEINPVILNGFRPQFVQDPLVH